MEHAGEPPLTRRSQDYEPQGDPSLPRSDRKGPIIRRNANVNPLEEEIGYVKVVDMHESFLVKTVRYVCLLRGHPRLFKKMRRVKNDIDDVLGTRRRQLQGASKLQSRSIWAG